MSLKCSRWTIILIMSTRDQSGSIQLLRRTFGAVVDVELMEFRIELREAFWPLRHINNYLNASASRQLVNFPHTKSRIRFNARPTFTLVLGARAYL